MPPSQRILDSHIHLWPSTATSSENHGWMSPGHVLAKRHGISDYLPVTSPPPSGFIYIETDRYLPSPSPDIHNADGQEEVRRKIVEWAKQPLEEIKFLRRIAEGKTEEGDGCEGDHDEKAEGQRMSPTPTYRFLEGQWEVMKGVVLYAPFHFSPAHFFLYMSIAEEVAGPRLWTRVVGFRYLLQGKGEGVVEGMLEGEKGGWWLSNLGELKTGNAGRGWCFDVGVDTHRDGMGPFEAVKGLIERTRVWEEKSESPGKPVRFVLNHLGKPPLSKQPEDRWLKGMSALGTDKDVYMKLSGAFNEFDEATSSDIPSLLTTLTPFLDHVFKCFPKRVMFGSDWPVCNVGGPKGDAGNWRLWREVVEKYIDEKGFGEEEKERVWWGAGCEAYGVEL